MADCPSYLGNNVVSLCTCSGGDQAVLSCNPGTHVDRIYCWSAPNDGTFQFDLAQTSPATDLALALFAVDSTCGELACNNSGSGSTVTLAMTSGQRVYIAIEETTGNNSFTLAINQK